MKTNKLILLGLICLTVAMPTTAQNRNEKKARTERAVKEAIAAKLAANQPAPAECLLSGQHKATPHKLQHRPGIRKKL